MKLRLRYSLFTLLVICTVVCVVVGVFYRQPTPDLSLHIVGNAHVGKASKTGIQITTPDSHFHVIVQNDSADTIRLWEPWNSWGHSNLMFDVYDAQGKRVGSIEKVPFQHAVDIPAYLELAPGQHHVIDVYLGRKEWKLPFDSLPTRTPKSLRLVARYTSNESAEASEWDVWTGSIRTRKDVTIGYWPQDPAED